MALSHAAHVAVWHSTFKAYPIAVQLFYDVQALAAELPQPPMPQSGLAVACITNSGAPLLSVRLARKSRGRTQALEVEE